MVRIPARQMQRLVNRFHKASTCQACQVENCQDRAIGLVIALEHLGYTAYVDGKGAIFVGEKHDKP